jgi:hypothetical protein
MADEKPKQTLEMASDAEVGLSYGQLFQQLFALQAQIEAHRTELEKRKQACQKDNA